MKHFLLPSLLLLSACAKPAIFGSNVPTDETHNLDAHEVEFAEDSGCQQDWVTENPEKNVAIAHALLKDLGIKIKKGNTFAGATTLPKILWVAPDFDERHPFDQAVLLSHELAHYCQVFYFGEDAFYLEMYPYPDSRWGLEMQAYAQSVRTMKKQGLPDEKILEYIEEVIKLLRKKYSFYGINPQQFEIETRRILRAAADL